MFEIFARIIKWFKSLFASKIQSVGPAKFMLPPILDIWAQKGGTGKTQLSAAIAIYLSRYLRVGVVDCDVDSSYFPEIVGMRGDLRFDRDGKFIPTAYQHLDASGKPVGYPIKVVSASLFPNPTGSSAMAVSKIGSEYYRIVRDLFGFTNWGDCEILVVDSPAGSGDPLRAILDSSRDKLIGSIAVVQPKTGTGLRRVIDLSYRLGNRILGIVENQKGIYCPKCNHFFEHMKPRQGAATIEEIAREAGIKYFGSLPHIVGLTDPEMPLEYRPLIKSVGDAVLKAFRPNQEPVTMERRLLALDGGFGC